MHQIHDKGYRRLFKNKGIFRQLLETFVAKDWVKELDFKTCETLDKSFVSEQYKETVSDIIHKIKLRRQNIFIVILTEFKSTVERFTSLDIARYVASFYKDYVESNKNVRMLPPVFPILLYNGNAKWTAPTKLSDLIEGSGYLGEYSLNFAYYKIAINEYPKRYLLRIKNVVSLLFLAEAYYDAKLLKREFLEVFEKEKDKGPISLLLNWFIQLRKHGRFPEKDVEKLERIYQSKKEVHAMLIEALEREKRELSAKVTAKAKREQQTEIARKMLVKGLNLPLIAEVTGLPKKVILQLKQEMEN
ncbi:Rpn family recombination-promoting nuclease/putative transposase [candidate division KSB1 bacterium]|nr:Rpn family recombination-promoting nuclease/putative transposase [candidate division KSB1 bacterium]